MNKYWLVLPALLLITLTSNAIVKMSVKGVPLTCQTYFTFSSPSQLQVEIPAGSPTEFITPNSDGSFTTMVKVGTSLKVVGSPATCSQECKGDWGCVQDICEPSIGGLGRVTQGGTITVTCQ